MRRNLIFALLMIFAIISFVACSDDKDDVLIPTATISIRDNTETDTVKDVYYKNTSDETWTDAKKTVKTGQNADLVLVVGETYEFMIQHRAAKIELNTTDFVTRYVYPNNKTVEEDETVAIAASNKFPNPKVVFVNTTDRTVKNLRLYQPGKSGDNYFLEILGPFGTSTTQTINYMNVNNIYNLQINFTEGDPTAYEEIVIDKDHTEGNGRFFFDDMGTCPPPA